jgi:hypothetical protein
LLSAALFLPALLLCVVGFAERGVWLASLLFAGGAATIFVVGGLYFVALRKGTAVFDCNRRVIEIDGFELAYDHVGEVHLEATEHKDADNNPFFTYTLVVQRKDAVARGKAMGAALRPEVDAWQAGAKPSDPMPEALRKKIMLAAQAYLGGSYELGMSYSREGALRVTTEVAGLLGVQPTYDDAVQHGP